MFILLNFLAINGPSINKFSLCKYGITDRYGLAFNEDNYQYYSFNLDNNKTTIIEKGTFIKTGNKLEFTNVEHIDVEENSIPKVLYYSRMSKKNFEKLERKPFAYGIKDYIFWKRYHVLRRYA